MADQNLRIVVAAETGAAQDAVGRLADEMAGLARATDGAGTEQQKLARTTAEATVKSQAAREAVERAKRAQSEATAVTQAFGKESAEAGAAMDRLRKAEEEATKATREAERALKGASDAVTEAAASADKKAEPALRRMNDALQRASKEADRTAGELRTLDARIEAASRSAGGFSAAWASFKGNLAANAVAALGGYVRDAGLYALDTAANFERMKTALGTTLGSTEAANAEFARLQQFAAVTPFSLEEVTDGFIKLKNRGLDAGERAMKAYGDTAGAMGKTMNDVVEAVADATTGEGERLKEFGINMHKQGDQVALTFRGVTQTVKFEAKAIEDYLIRLGETNFAGGMEAQSRTLAGMWSTMKDGLAQFTVQVMDSGVSPHLKEIMETISGMSHTGEFLSNVLGGTLAGAFAVLTTAAKGAALALEGTFYVVNTLLSPLGYLEDALLAVSSSTEDFARAKAQLDEANAAQNWARDEAVAVANATAATNTYVVAGIELVGVIMQQAEAHTAAAKAAKEHDDAEAKYLARIAKDEAKFADDQFEKSMFVGPALPPGYKKPDENAGKKAHKKANSLAMKRNEFSASIADFEFETTQDIRDADATAAAQAFEQESTLREMRLTEMDAAADAEKELSREHIRLVDEKLQADIEYARWQQENAVTDEQRQRASTAVEAAESRKKIALIKRAAAEEAAADKKRQEDLEKEMKHRQKVTETVVGAVTNLGETMVGVFEAMAEGERGAVAKMLADVLKGVAKKHAVLALAEFALAAGSAASYNIPGAIAHASAGGMHTAVAAAAGAGAVVAGKVWEANREPSGGGRGGGPSPFGRPGTGGSGSDPGAVDSDGLQAQDVPISHEQLRRGDPSVRRNAALADGPLVAFNGPVHIYGAGGKAEFVEDIRRAIDRSDRGGKRNRI